MNISSLLPPVNTAKLKQPKRSEIAVAGSEISKDAPEKANERQKRKRRGQERRRRHVKPLIEMRSGGDRRKDGERPSINLEV